MPRRPTVNRTALAALGAAAILGAATGAGMYAVLESPGTTVVRQVTVGDTSSPASTATGLTIAQIYRRARASVVEITVASSGGGFGPGGGGSQTSQGSGFVYDTHGHIVTNDHVVDGAQSISVQFSNGARYDATVVGGDSSSDLAVLKVNAPASLLTPLVLGDSSKVDVGDSVVAIGSPFGLEGTITSGIVSALHRQMTSPNGFAIDDSIQTDAAINHGNSGGPLLDRNGRVIGVNSQIESDSGGNDGVGFAVPSNTVRSVISQLLSGGEVRYAYLGISVETVSSATGVSATGARVTTVRDGTPAATAGLRANTDVIVALDGTKIESADELRSAIAGKQPGEKIEITYVRDGATKTVTATLAERPS
jgi:putative serine protease PepD